LSHSLRAGGFAGALLALAAATTLSDPSEASALGADTQAPTYMAHAAAAIDAAAMVEAAAPAAVETPAPAPAAIAPAPIAPAQIAPAQPAPVAAPAPAAEPETGHTLASLASGLIDALNSIVSPKAPLSSMVDAYAGSEIADTEQECLAGAIYFEARSEPLEGQLAVADVVINRTRSGRYPTTICAVVTQKAQFSFIRNGRFPKADKSSDAWRKAVAISRIARDKLASQVPSNVLWYHATYVSPSWGRRLTKVNQIGLHIFYS
jgi:hypothetical protein